MGLFLTIAREGNRQLIPGTVVLDALMNEVAFSKEAASPGSSK
jgi:hypothetical protein